MEKWMIKPTSVRIEASSICQLSCPLCPRTTGETSAVVGNGVLKFSDFKRLIDDNPQIQSVELGNFGEVFLNKELPQILQYAYQNNITTRIDEGVNLNYASGEALEALVKFQTSVVRCAIDGITQKVYERYRVGGDLRQVLHNIQMINSYKEKYKSTRPHLIFQFVIFGHNENQIESAIHLAKILKMELSLKLNFYTDRMQVINRDRVRKYLGYADRQEYLKIVGEHYKRAQCYELWGSPQVNWDGKLLGCSRNFWGSYIDNVFESGLQNSINNEKISYTRQMLMGELPLREDIPCNNCGVYKSMSSTKRWITKKELASGISFHDDPETT
jgi:MoaA/NifB/PqqE/SkfB family radical SAM enzyme